MTSPLDHKASILIVDDEPQIRKLLKTTLQREEWKVVEAFNGSEGLQLAAQGRVDIVILDLGLPDISGQEVLRKIREWSQIPVIILSALNEQQTIISALNAGADDYLTKPFSVEELVARINVCLRRMTQVMAKEIPILKFGDLEIDLHRRTVHRKGIPLKLTVTEYDLLKLFVRNADKVLTHRQILKEVWGPGNLENNHYPRVYVRYLRQKIEEDPDNPMLIQTETGVGYRFHTPL